MTVAAEKPFAASAEWALWRGLCALEFNLSTEAGPMDIAQRLLVVPIWTIAEAAESGRYIPQRVLDQWAADRKDAAEEIDRLRKLLEPSVWTCSDQDGSAWSCPDDAMDGADIGDSSELEGWARVAVVKATVQPDNSVKIETLI